MLLLDTGEHEYLVVHRQGEGDHRDERDGGDVDGPGDGVVARQPLQVAVLEHPHEGTQGCRKAEQIQDQCLDRDQHTTREEEQDHHRRDGEPECDHPDPIDDRTRGIRPFGCDAAHEDLLGGCFECAEFGDECLPGWVDGLHVADRLDAGRIRRRPRCRIGIRCHDRTVDDDALGGRDSLDLGQAGDLRGIGGDLGRGTRLHEHDVIGRALVPGKAFAQHLPGLGDGIIRRKRALIHLPEHRTQCRSCKDEQDRDRSDEHGPGPAHDESSDPRPHAIVLRCEITAAHLESVHVGTEDREERGNRGQCTENGEEADRDPRIREGAQEVLREDQQ